MKEQLIQWWIDYCNKPDLYYSSVSGQMEDRRKIAVETQYNRNVWEIENMYSFGKIRIHNTLDVVLGGEETINQHVGHREPHIIFWPTVEYAAKHNIKGMVQYELTKEMYLTLEKVYFGNFKQQNK